MSGVGIALRVTFLKHIYQGEEGRGGAGRREKEKVEVLAVGGRST